MKVKDFLVDNIADFSQPLAYEDGGCGSSLKINYEANEDEQHNLILHYSPQNSTEGDEDYGMRFDDEELDSFIKLLTNYRSFISSNLF